MANKTVQAAHEENFTKIRNRFLDKFVKILGLAEIRCYLLIARKTVGFQKEWTWISQDLFCKECNLTVNPVRAAIEKLKKRKLIEEKKIGKRRYYKILPLPRADNELNIQIAGNKSVKPEKGGESHTMSNSQCEKVTLIKERSKEVLKKNNTHTRACDELVDDEFIEKLQEMNAYEDVDVKSEYEALLLQNPAPMRRDLQNWLTKAKKTTVPARGKKEEKVVKKIAAMPSDEARKKIIFGTRDFEKIKNRVKNGDF